MNLERSAPRMGSAHFSGSWSANCSDRQRVYLVATASADVPGIPLESRRWVSSSHTSLNLVGGRSLPETDIVKMDKMRP